jgi:predicted unusual protein kinase regulating ubiquinone biosynthesis (AarF/ABC1/UbiB family)
MSFVKTMKNVFFLFHASWIILSEFILYWTFNSYMVFIDRLTSRLASINILYVKIFQAFALNNKLIDEKLNNYLLKYTDNAPWTNNDIDFDTLYNLEKDYNIAFYSNDIKPINSGMISLVFKATNTNTAKPIIVKLKRKNINQTLDEAIEKLLFFVYMLSFIPFFENYKIPDLINKNISIIQQQTDFKKEVENIVKIRDNCKNLKYVVVPKPVIEVTDNYPNAILMEYINGVTTSNVKEEDLEEFAKQVLKFGFVSTFIHGISHGDLHSGNILFIKDDTSLTHKHKIGLLDFGIIYELNQEFKKKFLAVLVDVFSTPPREIAMKIFQSGLIEPLEIIENLPKEHYDSIIDMLSNIINDSMNVSKSVTHIQMYDFIYNLNNYINSNNMVKLGIRPSDNLLKIQLALTMAHGVTNKLCKNDYLPLANKVINELFHTDIITRDDI